MGCNPTHLGLEHDEATHPGNEWIYSEWIQADGNQLPAPVGKTVSVLRTRIIRSGNNDRPTVRGWDPRNTLI
jgi:hypothetical protein